MNSALEFHDSEVSAISRERDGVIIHFTYAYIHKSEGTSADDSGPDGFNPPPFSTQMPFTLDPEPGEEVYLRKEFRGSHDRIFAMAVSNQAVYVSAQRFAVKQQDTWYFKRVPLGDVKEVRLVKQRPIYMIVLSAIMIIFGASVSFLMMWGALHAKPGEKYFVSGWPFAILVGGIIIPFIARGRKTLIVRMRKGRFKWKPQLAIDKKTRDLCASIQTELLLACKKAGIRTDDSQ